MLFTKYALPFGNGNTSVSISVSSESDVGLIGCAIRLMGAGLLEQAESNRLAPVIQSHEYFISDPPVPDPGCDTRATLPYYDNLG
jgi:hypothetical protein